MIRDIKTGSIDDRVGIRAMLAALATKLAKHVVVWKLDRFTRSSLGWELMIRRVWDADGELHLAADGGMVKSDPQSRFINGIKANAAELERNTIRERITRGRRGVGVGGFNA